MIYYDKWTDIGMLRLLCSGPSGCPPCEFGVNNLDNASRCWSIDKTTSSTLNLRCPCSSSCQSLCVKIKAFQVTQNWRVSHIAVPVHSSILRGRGGKIWPGLRMLRYYRYRRSVLLSGSRFRYIHTWEIFPELLFRPLGRCDTKWWHSCKFWQPTRNVWKSDFDMYFFLPTATKKKENFIDRSFFFLASSVKAGAHCLAVLVDLDLGEKGNEEVRENGILWQMYLEVWLIGFQGTPIRPFDNVGVPAWYTRVPDL